MTVHVAYNDAPEALPGFEGSEKRVEIDFFPAPKDRAIGGLRQLSRPQLDELLTLAECEIVSERHSFDFDAYVLSESSLFVYPTKFVLKTCGTTRLLNCIEKLVEITTAFDMRLRRVKFSRASYKYPLVQPAPHQSFQQEVETIEKAVAGHLPVGCAHVLGDARLGLQWHVYLSDADGVNSYKDRSRVTVELCMTDLKEEKAETFYHLNSSGKGSWDAFSATSDSGIAAMLPHTKIDDFLFEPCGYSMNGLLDSGFSTIHITPETDFSYASLELCGYSLTDYSTVLTDAAAVFKPGQLALAISSADASSLCLDWTPPNPPDMRLIDVSQQLFSCGGGVLFYRFCKIAHGEQFRKGNPVHIKETFSCSTPPQVYEQPPMRLETLPGDSLPNQHTRRDTTVSTSVVVEKYCQQIPSRSDKDMEVFLRSSIEKHSFDEVFYTVDLGVVHRLWKTWVACLPRVEPFYAVKCFGDEAVLALLASMGAGFDCASPAEIEAVMKLGVAPDRIVYANPCKKVKHLAYARERDVRLTTFDSEAELKKLAAQYPGSRLLLRIRADDPAARCPLGDKYGAEEYEVEGLFKTAKQLSLNVVGISFHVGSGATDPDSFTRAIALARDAFCSGSRLGFNMHILDIGGGFSGGAAGVSIKTVAASINKALELHFPADEGVRVISEPGRYFAEACATLCCNVFGKRVRKSLAPQLDTHAYWIPDGLYASFNCLLYDHATVSARPLPPAKAKGVFPGRLRQSTVFGPTCDGLDQVLRGVMLPELEVGEWLVFENMGAYTSCAGSNFNGFESPSVHTVYIYSQSDK